MVDLIRDEKRLLRQIFLKKRFELDQNFYIRSSNLICSAIADFIANEQIKFVYTFRALPQEIDLGGLFNAVSSEVKFALPRIYPERTLKFFLWKPGDPLIKNKHSIEEPVPDEFNELTNVSKSALMLVPALAIDEQGNRLGYGGGYYDRYLASHPGLLTLAPILESWYQVTLPHTDFDQPVKLVQTEKQFVRFSNVKEKGHL